MSPLFTRDNAKLLAKMVMAACLLHACITLTRMAQAHFLAYQVANATVELSRLKMKTLCIGRFLIDVPADAEVAYQAVFIAGGSIRTYADETDGQFAARVKEKDIELSDKKNEREMRSLESEHPVDHNGVHGKIHVFDRKWMRDLPSEKNAENVKIEAMVREQSRSFDLMTSDADDIDPKKLALLVSQFRARAENEIPTEAGFCFDGGFIAEPITARQRESTTISVSIKGHPDMSIMLDMTAGIAMPKTLLQREAESDTEHKFSARFHVFRRGSRWLNGQFGAELLERTRKFNGDYSHSFMWQATHNDTDNVFTPYISFEMSTGAKQSYASIDSSLTDAEALALWDKLLSSLRVRPVVQAQPVVTLVSTIGDDDID